MINFAKNSLLLREYSSSTMFLINVDGEIVANDKNHYAQGWACCNIGKPVEDKTYYYDKYQHAVQSNLILDKNTRAVPYAIYATDKGIGAKFTGEIFAASGAMAAELCYKDNISEIESLLNVSIPSEIEIYFYNGLLTGVFSVLELFLSDVLLCLIFTNSEVYKRALVYLKQKGKLYNSDYNLLIQKHFTQDVVYHKFDQTQSLFKKVLHIKLPDLKHLQDYLHKRNNITHRFAFSNIDRMKMTVIDSNTLHKFISHCNEFVDKIMREINSVY